MVEFPYLCSVIKLYTMAKKIKLKVDELVANPFHSNIYALILVENGGERRIPIIIGAAEAQSIIVLLEKVPLQRPLTQDLVVSVLHSFGILMQEVFLYKFEEGVFFSEIVLFDGQRQVRVDSRTSDAVALALRMNVDIYTTDDLLIKYALSEDNKENESDYLYFDDKNKELYQKMDDIFKIRFNIPEALDELFKNKNESPQNLEDTFDHDDDGDDWNMEELTPEFFESEELLHEWLASLPKDCVKARMAYAIEQEKYEDAKIYSDELERRKMKRTSHRDKSK